MSIGVPLLLWAPGLSVEEVLVWLPALGCACSSTIGVALLLVEAASGRSGVDELAELLVVMLANSDDRAGGVLVVVDCEDRAATRAEDVCCCCCWPC